MSDHLLCLRAEKQGVWDVLGACAGRDPDVQIFTFSSCCRSRERLRERSRARSRAPLLRPKPQFEVTDEETAAARIDFTV